MIHLLRLLATVTLIVAVGMDDWKIAALCTILAINIELLNMGIALIWKEVKPLLADKEE